MLRALQKTHIGTLDDAFNSSLRKRWAPKLSSYTPYIYIHISSGPSLGFMHSEAPGRRGFSRTLKMIFCSLSAPSRKIISILVILEAEWRQFKCFYSNTRMLQLPQIHQLSSSMEQRCSKTVLFRFPRTSRCGRMAIQAPPGLPLVQATEKDHLQTTLSAQTLCSQ